MPKFTSSETETDVRRLSKEHYSKVAIKNKLKEENIDVSVRTITRILENVGIRRQALSQKKPIPKFKRSLVCESKSQKPSPKKESCKLSTDTNDNIVESSDY